ncbi:MAG: hypothetical protein ACI8ZW_001279 [Yoonia sp.]|jgi:hypothetical protein
MCLFSIFLTTSRVYALARLRIDAKNLLDHALTAGGSEVFLLRFSPIFTGLYHGTNIQTFKT